MGTWASDNFGNDGACDYRATVVDLLLKTFKQPGDLFDIDEVMAAGAMILAICDRCGVPGGLLDFDLDTLQTSVLRVYDAEIDDYARNPDYKRDRREVIVQTFNELKVRINSEKIA